MDWNSSDLLLGAEIDEFRSEKTVKAEKVSSATYIPVIRACVILSVNWA